jgi:hypothetical protein
MYDVYIKPLKMDLTEGSETSANINQTPGNHSKVDMLSTEHGESLKSGITQVCQSPYGPDLAPCYFQLFRKLKSPLKGS